MTSVPCRACGAAPGLCRQDCAEEQLRQLGTRDLALAAAEWIERRATGQKVFRHEGHAIRWYFETRESWQGPKAIPLQTETGRPSRGAENPARRAFAAVAYALLLVERDERAAEGGAPIREWIEAHHAYGLSYERIAGRMDYRWSTDAIKRRMARAHRLVRERLAEKGWIEDPSMEVTA